MNTSERIEIPGFPGYYADIQGNIWSAFTNWRGYGTRRLKAELNTHGYLRVRLVRDDSRISKPVHVLVCLAFHGIPNEGEEVRHKDGDRLNNRPDNLAWGTRKENALDRELHGRTAKGSRNAYSKLVEAQVLMIKRRLEAGDRPLELAQQFSISVDVIRRIRLGKAWAHVE